MSTPSPAVEPPVPSLLKVLSLVVAVLVVVQLVLGMMTAGRVHGIKEIHGYLGMATFLITAVAALSAWMWYRHSGPAGVMGHTVGMTVMMIAQIGLGEGGLKVPHMVLGFLIVLAGIALPVVVLDRKPLS